MIANEIAVDAVDLDLEPRSFSDNDLAEEAHELSYICHLHATDIEIGDAKYWHEWWEAPDQYEPVDWTEEMPRIAKMVAEVSSKVLASSNDATAIRLAMEMFALAGKVRLDAPSFPDGILVVLGEVEDAMLKIATLVDRES